MNIQDGLKTLGQQITLRLRQWVGVKTVIMGLLVLDLLWFGNVLMVALGHALHLVIMVVETALVHLLEQALDLSHRQAQFVLVYSALIASLMLLAYFIRKAYREAQIIWADLQAWRREQAQRRQAAGGNQRWQKWVLVLGAIGATISLVQLT